MPRRMFAAFLALAALSVATFDASANAPAQNSSTLKWTPCDRGFECATLDVPVDYSDPDREHMQIAVIRALAADRSRRVGSLVVNFGGPGVPGAESLPLALDTMPEAIRERFDIVSFDPRGTGASRPVDCVDDQTFTRLWSEDPTPDSTDELPSYYDGSAFSEDLVAACIARQGDWLARVGTRNTVRDLDRLRAALGEDRINFLGYSYGTVIGAVYAQEFPKRIRTMVLDSAVDLSATAEQRLRRNAQGFEQALDAFVQDCRSSSICPLSDGDPRAALEQLRDRFEEGLVLEAVDGRVGVSEFYGATVLAMYSTDTWPALALAVAQGNDGDGALLRLLNDSITGRRLDGTYNNFQEAIGIILCDDSFDARVPADDYERTYADLAREAPFFGRLFASAPLGCDPRLPRPRADEQLGDVRADRTVPPILIVGVTGDPATPYEGARDLARRLPHSRLLTLESTQHAGYGFGITCIDRAVDRYLLLRKLPPRRTRCAGAGSPDL